MAKTVWATRADFVSGRTPAKDMEKLGDEYFDVFKRAAEARMALYDAQPKLVRMLIGEIGCQADLDKACLRDRRIKATAKKTEILRQAYARRLERRAVKLEG